MGPVWASFPSLYKTRVRILVYFGAAKVLCFTFSPSYAALIIETKDDCKTFTTQTFTTPDVHHLRRSPPQTFTTSDVHHPSVKSDVNHPRHSPPQTFTTSNIHHQPGSPPQTFTTPDIHHPLCKIKLSPPLCQNVTFTTSTALVQGCLDCRNILNAWTVGEFFFWGR